MSGHGEHVLAGGGLGVRFLFRDDRFAHEVWLEDGALQTPLLTSVEGTAADDWPPSPAFQSLNVETRPDGGKVVLLVGMAGKSHWSASVELDVRSGAMRFDIACRTHSGAASTLSSSYRTLSPMVEESSGRVAFDVGPSSAERPWVALCESVGPATLSIREGTIGIAPVVAANLSGARTIRWGYEIARGRPTRA